jgi:hypothetical protein
LLLHPFLNDAVDPEHFKHPSIKGGAGGDSSTSKKSSLKLSQSRRLKVSRSPHSHILAGSVLSLSDSLQQAVSFEVSNSRDAEDSSDDDGTTADKRRGNVSDHEEYKTETVMSLPDRGTATWMREDINNAIAEGYRMDTAEFNAMMGGSD